ncbi:Enoyl-CoA hydratase/carnithine racemase [Fictibacillus enclensis]|uniref:Enoyl-CoA hydratase n=1 Tax=Fictibacillus enclensis TaxID=1017270 RepID=A0A0V8JAG3_9BACL|nr:enoyl-CoA hydratase-related protein [Fictibacillus enclensis]KSU84134.1 enoyl-CoA hydratase [Fictibacillus enclensis]SCB73634.1 Enoyl-CoA hydratase/carnithine racemase [Fictibacillus enclensis]
MPESILYQVKNHIAYVTLNRPEVLNCFNFPTLQRLGEVVEEIHHSQDVRVVIFTGAGEKAFSAGADLKERRTLSEADVKRNVRKIRDVFSSIEALPQPTIAAINGHAFGGGFELALACDIRVSSEAASMGLTELSWAIIPGAGGTQRLPRLIGQAKALELILTAKKLTAAAAEQYGILNRTVSKAELMAVCEEYAAAILKNGPVAVQQAKYAVKHGMETDLQTGLAIEAKAYELTIPTKDRVEALEAFGEKRAPVFKGE